MKVIRKCVLGMVFLGLASIKTLGQQVAQYSQYMSNSVIVNPAVAGIESYTDIRSSFRKQWVGLEGSPISFYTSAHTSIGKNDRNATTRSKFRKSAIATPKSTGVNKNNRFYRVNPHHGVGAIVQVDKAGLLNTSSVNFLYSYHLPITSELNVASGISAGALRTSFNAKEARAVDATDPALQGSYVSTLKPDISVGVWVYTPTAFLGVSGTQLISSGDDFKDAYSTVISGRMQPHFYITGGYRFKVNRGVMLTPSIMYRKATGTPASIDLNVKAMYSERMWVGLSYRNKDSFTVLGGLFVSPLLDFGYSYDLNTSDLNATNAGSHEILVGFKLNNKRNIICPQWIW
ncbi:type IX secretion system membrane protein PorP/SprF [Rufibacter sp. LB8]|uniref:PorP/SprF family type IX secretion system membrane protein n=1 Tax=Rufibacter sp. LB8 TaxID=2777781 RepID=UPI00178C293D|nr:type IX secretion system membrane protein PorP/SprF [Rufibacter sp. LB8]